MTDKSWMLNAKAIAAAKQCISVVELELGVKLKLSHPDFLELLVEYMDLTDSQALHSALAVLAQFAPPELQVNLSGSNNNMKVVELGAVSSAKPIKLHHGEAESAPESVAAVAEIVEYKGKAYPRYCDGLKFKGLYRGQAHYA